MSVAPVSTSTPEPLWRRVIGSPSTGMGRLAAWLAGGAMLLLALDGGLVAAGLPGWGWAAEAVLVLTSLAGLCAAVAAGALAVGATVRGERSIVVLGPLLFGAFCVAFLLGLLSAG